MLLHRFLTALVALPIVAAQLIFGGQRPESWVGHWVLDWSPAHAFASEFHTTEGHTDYPLPNWLFYSQVAGSPRLLFPLPCRLELITRPVDPRGDGIGGPS